MIFAVLFRVALLVAAILLNVPFSWSQQQQTLVLIGEIRIARGSFPPHRIQVSLETRGAVAQVTYADDEGKFMFAELWPNVYYVVINDSDFEPVRQSVELRALSGNSTVVQVMLTPRERQAEKPSKDNTSGGNPFLVNTSEYAKTYPKDAVKEFDKANKAVQKGDTANAVQHFEKAVSLAPGFYAARNNLGLTYLAKMDFSSAEKQFLEVLRINPSDEQAYFNLGNAYLLSKQFAAAEKSIQEGLQKRPDSAFGQLLLGTVYDQTGNSVEAEKLLRQALTLDPSMSKAHLELVNLYLRQRKNGDAVAELRAFLKTSPSDPFAPKAREVLRKLEQQPNAH